MPWHLHHPKTMKIKKTYVIENNTIGEQYLVKELSMRKITRVQPWPSLYLTSDLLFFHTSKITINKINHFI